MKLHTGYPQTFPCIDILIPLSCVFWPTKPHILGFGTLKNFDQVKVFPLREGVSSAKPAEQKQNRQENCKELLRTDERPQKPELLQKCGGYGQGGSE
ncbi:MAG: hypothetical protein CBE03_001995 [Gammaproteobacteria bacterium TMED243]|nr:MAG: hypothetical protein CBE03_003555 [Gammaproteobacteria bacterium TMED243]RPG33454.1 MAG: hypothetical protein CBE03_001995 [Gammaproteobacteria bacterium TMED243]